MCIKTVIPLTVSLVYKIPKIRTLYNPKRERERDVRLILCNFNICGNATTKYIQEEEKSQNRRFGMRIDGIRGDRTIRVVFVTICSELLESYVCEG